MLARNSHLHTSTMLAALTVLDWIFLGWLTAIALLFIFMFEL